MIGSQPSQPARQSGLSLIEVLIAMLVLSFGLLGLAGMQVSALANTRVAQQYTQAAILALNITDKMRANLEGVRAGNYTLAAGATPADPGTNCGTTACDAAQLAAWDLAVWYSSIDADASYSNGISNAAAVPRGKASVICVDEPACTDASLRVITIYWDANGRADASPGYGCDPDVATDLACYRVVFAP